MFDSVKRQKSTAKLRYFLDICKKIVILHEIFELYGKKYKKRRLFGYKTRFYNA